MIVDVQDLSVKLFRYLAHREPRLTPFWRGLIPTVSEPNDNPDLPLGEVAEQFSQQEPHVLGFQTIPVQAKRWDCAGER